MVTKAKTTKKKKETNLEFRVRKISNGYIVTTFDCDEYTNDLVKYCSDREQVIDYIEGLVF